MRSLLRQRRVWLGYLLSIVPVPGAVLLALLVSGATVTATVVTQLVGIFALVVLAHVADG